MATPPKDHDPDQTPPADDTPLAGDTPPDDTTPDDETTERPENRDAAPTTTVITPASEPAVSRARRFRTPAIIVAASLVGLLLLGGVFAGGVAVGRFSDRGDRGGYSSAENGQRPGGPGGGVSNDRGPGNHAPGDMTRPTDPRGGDVSDGGDGDDSTDG